VIGRGNYAEEILKLKKLQDLNFLIVDDMQNMRRTIRNMLLRIGVQKRVLEADDGDSAWDKLQHNPIDFVICDWNMPRMKGIELLRKMREMEQFAEIPFLMLTAEIEERTIAQAAEIEIDAYIIKPFILNTLIQKIDEALRRRNQPTEGEILFKTGNEHLKEGSLPEAIEALERVLQLSPHTPKVYVSLGDAYFAANDVSKAKEMYEKAVSLSDQHTKALDRLAKVYGMEGRSEDQVKMLKKAVQVSPDVPGRQLQLGKALMSMGQKEEARQAIEVSLKQDPGNVDLAKEAGEIFLAADMNDHASKAFKKAISLMPKEVETYNRLGVALRKQKKYMEAIKEYRKALEIEAHNEVILYNISIAYFQQGLQKEAKDSLKTLLRQNPNHAMAQKALDSLANGSGPSVAGDQ
jgi:tetratricopeptide (TPR) repeat protein